MNLTNQEQASKENECKNCKSHFQGLYCNKCGQKLIQERNTLKHFFELIFDFFNIERGLSYTIKLLFTNPGQLINEYLTGRTKDFYNPLKYLFIIVGLSTIFVIWSDIFDTNLENTKKLLGSGNEENNFQSLVDSYVKEYLNLITILILPFYSLISKWIFKKHKQYYAEHLIINSYLFAQYTLMQTIILFIVYFIPGLIKFLDLFGLAVFVSYYTYALRSIYKIKFLKSFVASIGIFVISALLFLLSFLMLGIIVLVVLQLSGANLKELIA